MGQVKIWLNSQLDISEIPKFLLLIMIVITVFFVIHAYFARFVSQNSQFLSEIVFKQLSGLPKTSWT